MRRWGRRGHSGGAAPAKMHFVGPLERLRYLRSVAAFEQLPMDEVLLLGQNVREVSFRSGETLIGSGEGKDLAYLIVDGSVRVEGRGPEPASVQGGGSVGFISLLAGQELEQHCVAESDVAALELERDIFWDILEDRFAIFVPTMREVASELLVYRQMITDGTVLSGVVDPPSIPADRPIELVERLIAMRGTGVFKRASLDAIIEFSRTLEECRIPAGTVLWRAWEPSGFAHFVIRGSVHCRLPDGRVFRSTVGYPVGNLESQAREPRWYTATAETDLVTFRSESNAYLDILEDHFDMAEEFLTTLASNVIRARVALDEKGLRKEVSA
ncbi:MAG: cyclic nucleotide-binding domain-containing protein [Candidatus Eisenbacteria bacterium]